MNLLDIAMNEPSKFRIVKSNSKLQCSILYDYNFI